MRHRIAVSAVAIVGLLFTAGGLVGSLRYTRGYWLYRGYPPPRAPSYIAQGSVEEILVTSQAVGRRQAVYVFLPPGYRNQPGRRYPVLYLLHGYPGIPGSFLTVGQVDIDEAVLVARGQMEPTIMVMPSGGFFNDQEWADGLLPHSAWETFVARDLVNAVDRRYRTIARGAGRAIAGLSEGGYGALNIALHHPGEFGVVESWSGYVRARNAKVFGAAKARVDYNSPGAYLLSVAPQLREAGTYLWFYVGAGDPLLPENEAFASELTRLGIAHHFFVGPGAHSWGLWRPEIPTALIVASEHLANA